MFFSRLRRRAKWVFVALAAVFALSFVFLGVGAGGSGIGDYLADLFRGGPNGGSSPSVNEARAKVEENPNDLEARRDLVSALQATGQFKAAIPHLERYTTARPTDVEAFQQLAALYGSRAQVQQAELAEAQNDPSGSAFAGEIADPASPLSESLSGPITQLQQERAATRTNELVLAAQSTYSKQADTWERLTKLQPEEPSNYLQLGQAQFFAGSTPEAIAAWERFLELAPDDPNAPLVRRQIRSLKQSVPSTGG
jgi:tetratricopeptide (TPR) repeat protein